MFNIPWYNDFHNIELTGTNTSNVYTNTWFGCTKHSIFINGSSVTAGSVKIEVSFDKTKWFTLENSTVADLTGADFIYHTEILFQYLRVNWTGLTGIAKITVAHS